MGLKKKSLTLFTSSPGMYLNIMPKLEDSGLYFQARFLLLLKFSSLENSLLAHLN